MIVAGVDLGVRKAAVSIWEDGELLHVSDYESEDIYSRPAQLGQVAAYVLETMVTWSVDQIFIEKPLVGRNVDISMQISQMAGAIMCEFAFNEAVGVHLVNVKTWKKDICGNGNVDKAGIRNWLEAYSSAYAELCGSNQDRTDAVAIGLYGYLCATRANKLMEAL